VVSPNTSVVRIELVEGVADGRIRAAARGGVGFAALGRHPQILQRPLLAAQLARHLHELARRARGAHDGVVVAMQLDAEADHRLAGLLDAFHHARSPLLLDADHYHRGDVRIRAGADQRAEVQLQVGAELQPAVGMRQRQRALDVVRHGLGRCVREIVDRQDDDVVTHADPSIFSTKTEKRRVLEIHHLFVFTL
jgi:hypothetical protein